MIEASPAACPHIHRLTNVYCLLELNRLTNEYLRASALVDFCWSLIHLCGYVCVCLCLRQRRLKPPGTEKAPGRSCRESFCSAGAPASRHRRRFFLLLWAGFIRKSRSPQTMQSKVCQLRSARRLWEAHEKVRSLGALMK